MSRRNQLGPCHGLLLLSLGLFTAGCSRGNSVASFHPHEDDAREAIETALTAWQNGLEKPGVIDGVQLVDPTWAAGAKLTSFEIVEEFPGESPRKFSVKLNLAGTAAPKDETYYVVGIEPLQVMNKSEFERQAGM